MVRSLQPQWPAYLDRGVRHFRLRRRTEYPALSSVPCRVTTWGPLSFSGLSVPVPNGARPSTGSDSAMVVVDEHTNAVYEFWGTQTRPELVGGIRRRQHPDRFRMGAVPRPDRGHRSSAGSSGWPRSPRTSRTPWHLQTNNACAVVFRSPAIKTDGRSARSTAFPKEPGCSSIPRST